MSVSQLKYRIPGKQLSSLTGSFKRLTEVELLSYSGFIFGTFDLGDVYGFYHEVGDEEVGVLKTPFCMTADDYVEIAEGYIDRLKENELDKIILSRIQSEKLGRELDDIFDSLCNAYPNAFVYLIESPSLGTWIGATPERLLQSNGKRASVIALAGTKLVNDESPWRKKEIEEQAYVTDYIRNKLAKIGAKDVRQVGPVELAAGPVKHLFTELTFDDQHDPWRIVKEMHPTPAVCGLPKQQALELILESEPHQRKFYTGVIGLIGPDETELFVNLRCAQVIDDEFFMYLGGGLTKFSDPNEEWVETVNKGKTLKAFI